MDISESATLLVADLVIFLFGYRAEMITVLLSGLVVAVIGLVGIGHAAWRARQNGDAE